MGAGGPVTGKNALYNLINAVNGTDFDETNVELSNAMNLEIPTNAKVTLTAVPGGGYTGTVDVMYNRLNIRTALAARGFDNTTEVVYEGEEYFNDLIIKMNEAFGINLTTDDMDEAYPLTPPRVPPGRGELQRQGWLVRMVRHSGDDASVAGGARSGTEQRCRYS